MTVSWTGEERRAERLAKREIEERLMSTAKMLVKRNGLTVSLEHLRLDQLMELAQIPKTSFYRVWENKDAFFTQLLEDLVSEETDARDTSDFETREIVYGVIRENEDLLESMVGREKLFAEAIRVGVQQVFVSVSGSATWQTHFAVLATLPGIADGESKSQLEAALRSADMRFVERIARLLDDILPALSYRFKDGLTSFQAAAACSALFDGFAQRDMVNPKLVGMPVMGPALRGGVTQWHLVALGFLGVIQAMVEPVGGAVVVRSTGAAIASSH